MNFRHPVDNLNVAKKMLNSTEWRQKHQTWTIPHSFLAIMGGLAAGDEDGNLHTVAQSSWHEFNIDDATLPSEEQILDRSKADTVTRVITFVQVFWVLIQVVGRLAQRLTISTLEVATVGYIFCAIATYVAWWGKPLDVPAPYIVRATYHQTTETRQWPEKIGEIDSYFLDNIYIDSPAFTAVFAIFGGIHITAWAYPFPTISESWYWRGLAILLTVYPFLWMSFVLIARLQLFGKKGDEAITQFVGVVGSLYSVIHIIVLCEAFLSLRLAPPGIYQQVEWTNFLTSSIIDTCVIHLPV